MNAAGRMGLYAAGVVVAFTGAFGIAAAVVPDNVVAAWDDAESVQEHSAAGSGPDSELLPGLSLSTHGYSLSPVSAPTAVGEKGELGFWIATTDGEPLTTFKTSHEKDLHLIVVRNDGTRYRHVHPTLDKATGTWSTPWTWDEAGTYRVYADFAPAVADGPDKVTLTRAVDVAGTFTPVSRAEGKTSDTVDGFDVRIDGNLVAGSASELTMSVERDGEPVESLQPYLGAFGHLVALRDGDLAYLHVHTEGDEPETGDTSGPEISFAAEAPTAGLYLLYLDFQVDGEVHTATFVLDASSGNDASKGGSHDGTDSGH